MLIIYLDSVILNVFWQVPIGLKGADISYMDSSIDSISTKSTNEDECDEKDLGYLNTTIRYVLFAKTFSIKINLFHKWN